MLKHNDSKKKDIGAIMAEAQKSKDDELIQQAWADFRDSVVQTIEEREVYFPNIDNPNQKYNAPFMKIKDYDNERQFRKVFLNDNEQVAISGANQKMSIGDFGKGLLLNEWGDYQQQANRVDGSVITPVHILSDIIYSAREYSVLLGNCPMLPMEEGKVLIGKVKDDLELDFKVPYEEGKETTLGLEGVILEAKTLYAYVEISEEDLQDMKNIESILSKAFAMAVAKALDNNFLYTNPKSQDESQSVIHNKYGMPIFKHKVYPDGILDSPNINKIVVPKADYDMIAKANLEISKANGKSNTVGFNPLINYELQTSKDSTGQYINPPSFYNDLAKIESNGLKENDVIVFDSNQVLIGLRKSMDIKVLPDLKKGTVIMRCMLRADVVPTREEHICRITINEDEGSLKKSKTK